VEMAFYAKAETLIVTLQKSGETTAATKLEILLSN